MINVCRYEFIQLPFDRHPVPAQEPHEHSGAEWDLQVLINWFLVFGDGSCCVHHTNVGARKDVVS